MKGFFVSFFLQKCPDMESEPESELEGYGLFSSPLCQIACGVINVAVEGRWPH